MKLGIAIHVLAKYLTPMSDFRCNIPENTQIQRYYQLQQIRLSGGEQYRKWQQYQQFSGKDLLAFQPTPAKHTN